MYRKKQPIQKTFIALIAAMAVGYAYSNDKLVNEPTIKIMTFNIWRDGKGGKQPLSQTVRVIQMAQADIVGLQEVNENAKAIAELLGWNYIQQTRDTAILSRFKILETTDNRLGVKIRCDSGKVLYVFNVHFAHAPYQPYQLLNIPYANAPFLKTEAEAVAAANDARGHEVTGLIKEIDDLKGQAIPVIITGDFNEPSHLDWTQAAAEMGRHPIRVRYPTTSALEKANFIDTYRAMFPDEIRNPGFTWTPLTTLENTNDHHDRIDFIFCNNTGLKIANTMIVGENKAHAELVVTPYPSDHRAIVTTFILSEDFKK
ncbi:MAG: endonuclease/exonuclease/phosphatase family protein [Pontiellaceae bacterium]|nr:endonuclease/exonuclease/phosphatase family protein [Pontiellaceae bacterium]MBN2783689.1 endonuclease/exonuclease/phosphatase family protein [Pontiellaceae bacterium]